MQSKIDETKNKISYLEQTLNGKVSEIVQQQDANNGTTPAQPSSAPKPKLDDVASESIKFSTGLKHDIESTDLLIYLERKIEEDQKDHVDKLLDIIKAYLSRFKPTDTERLERMGGLSAEMKNLKIKHYLTRERYELTIILYHISTFTKLISVTAEHTYNSPSIDSITKKEFINLKKQTIEYFRHVALETEDPLLDDADAIKENLMSYWKQWRKLYELRYRLNKTLKIHFDGLQQTMIDFYKSA